MRLSVFTNWLQALGLASIVILFLASLITTCLSALGVLPWLSVEIAFGETSLQNAGAYVQIGMTVFLLTLLTFIPSSLRVMRLEHAHRRFEIDMDDVTRAYRAAHIADRSEVFEMRREFDAVRERYRYLKSQPDLEDMDDMLLTIAAQMSEQSKDLAERFSDNRMQRLREQLRHRRQEVDELMRKAQSLRNEADALKTLSDDIEDDEVRVIATVLSATEALTPRRPAVDNVKQIRDFQK